MPLSTHVPQAFFTKGVNHDFIQERLSYSMEVYQGPFLLHNYY